MHKHDPVPDGAKALVLKCWGCGDTCCCHAMQIRAIFEPTHPRTPPYYKKDAQWSQLLWEGDWFNTDGYLKDEELQERLDEAKEACIHYGIPFVCTDLDYWEWEAEKKL